MVHVTMASLWMPIVLAAIIVFFASSMIWMVLQYHNSDWSKLPDEENIRGALKGVAPGQYGIPYAASNSERSSEEWKRKFSEGPTAMLVVMSCGDGGMGKQLARWFVYCLAISFFVAYVASVALFAGAEYLKVFQIVGTVAFLAYAGASAQGSIWFGHPWRRTVKELLDGLIYGLLTAGVFGWLWPAP